MDPLSVIASITGILIATVQISSAASSLITKWREAPSSLHGIVIEMSALRACLAQLKPYLLDLNTIPSARTAIISVEQVVVILSSCVLSVSELQKSLDFVQPEKALTVMNKLWWASHKKKINTSRSRVQASTSSLNLVLTVITCTTAEESRKSINRLETMLDHILQTETDLSSKFPRRLTDDRSRRYALSTNESKLDASDDASVITVRRLNAPGDSVSVQQRELVFGLDAEIEHGLFSSIVYLRAKGRRSSSSLPSVSVVGSKGGWSFCSYFSLSQISSISVLSLPISPWELWKPGQYVVPTGTDVQTDHDPLNFPSWNLNGLLAAHTMARCGPKSPSRPQSTRTAAYDIILDQTLMGSRTFTDFGKNDNITKVEFTRARDTNIWIDHLLSKKSHDQGVKERILVLDASESSRSTLVRQMSNLYRKDFEYFDRLLYREHIRSNLLGAFKSMVEICQTHGFTYSNPLSAKYEETIIKASSGRESKFSSELTWAMQGIWKEKSIARAYSLLDGFPMRYDFHYFIEGIDRIAGDEYLPTDDDIKCTYSIIPGVYECFFSLKPFRRNRCLHVFDASDLEGILAVKDIKTVIIILPWSEILHHGAESNQLHQIFSLFSFILKPPEISRSRLILMFDKNDHAKNTDMPYPARVDEFRMLWERKFTEVAGAAGIHLILIYDIDLSDKEDTKRKLDIIFHIGDYDPTYGVNG